MQRIFNSCRRDLETAGAAGLALLVLCLGVTTNRYRVEAIPFRPHTEHFAILVALVALGWLALQKRARVRFQPADALLGLYLALALVSSLVFPIEPRESAQYWVRMFLAIVVYFLTRWLMAGEIQRTMFRLAIKAVLIFGVLEALLGIVSWFAYPLGINLGVDQYPLGVRGPGGIVCNFSLTMYGTLWEPNVFGSTIMLVLIVGAALFVSNEFKSWRKHLGLALCILVVALGLNASRAAFLTLAIGLGFIVLFVPGMTFFQKLKWAGAAVVLLLMVNVPSQELSRSLMELPSAPGLAERARCAAWIAAEMPRGTQEGDPEFDPSTGPDSESAVVNRFLEGQTLAARFVAYTQAWDDFMQRPLLGNGANSYGQKYTTTAHTPGWISNMILMSLHDTGVIGTVVLLGWFLWFGWMTWRRGWFALASAQRTMVLGLGIGLICLFLAYQVTSLLWFGLMWWLLAVLESGVNSLKRVSLDV